MDIKEFTPKEIESLDTHSDPLVVRAWVMLKELLSDPSQKFRQEVISMGNLIADEMRNTRENKKTAGNIILTNEGEDKLLERVLKIVDKAELFVSVMRGNETTKGSGKSATTKKTPPTV